jgi:hypothetical protein
VFWDGFFPLGVSRTRGTSSNKKAKDKQKPEVQLNAICDIERIQMECRREIHEPHHKVRVEKQALEQTDPHLEDLSSQNESTPHPSSNE